MVCPYLARPNARRGTDALIVGAELAKGRPRGAGGAVASFDRMEFRLGDSVLFQFAGLGEFRSHNEGIEQLAALAEAVGAERSAPPSAPDYLLRDEGAAEARMKAYVEGRTPAP